MGKLDIQSKVYMSDKERFADIFNYYLYDGAQVIDPEGLEELDSNELLTLQEQKEALYSQISDIQEEEDRIDMCKAWEDNKKDAKEEGIKEGRLVSIAKVIEKGGIEIAKNMLEATEEEIILAKQYLKKKEGEEYGYDNKTQRKTT